MSSIWSESICHAVRLWMWNGSCLKHGVWTISFILWLDLVDCAKTFKSGLNKSCPGSDCFSWPSSKYMSKSHMWW